MIVLGLAISLGAFFFEVLKAVPLLSQAVFDSANVTVPAPDLISQVQRPSALPKAELPVNSIVPAIAIVVVLTGLALFYFCFGRLPASPVFTASLNLVSTSAEASASLGLPVHADFGAHGVLRDGGSSGYAILSSPVSGSNRKGKLFVVANRMREGWDNQRAVLLSGGPPCKGST